MAYLQNTAPQWTNAAGLSDTWQLFSAIVKQLQTAAHFYHILEFKAFYDIHVFYIIMVLLNDYYITFYDYIKFAIIREKKGVMKYSEYSLKR